MSHFPRLFSFAAAVFITAVSPFTLNAQSSRTSVIRDTAAVAPLVVDTSRINGEFAPVGPRVASPAFTPPAATVAAVATRQGNSGSESLGAGSNVALMGVGVAAIIAGSLIDGDGGTMISIAGGVVALIGLFRYLR